ncbi:pectinesterase family protein [Salipaludibacillus sp. HK11]|uniref:pectinesterase family protein n=1 Tax=Salipaludibacillus sp. HK11 TaxID=3394320 RepID=UPI0039FD7265
MNQVKILKVTKNNINDKNTYSTIQEAINAVRVHDTQHTEICIAADIYKEKVIVPANLNNLTLIGESATSTKIVFDDGAKTIGSSGKPLGTFGTASVEISGDFIKIKHLTIENSAGKGENAGQAIALALHGDHIELEDVTLLGYQDTFYSSKGHQYLKKCRIEGDIDYIFGAGTVLFDNCEVYSRRRGYITAAATPKKKKLGFVFRECTLIAGENVKDVYLGRPWRPYAHTLFYRTKMGSHINKQGWHNWRNQNNEKTARYEELNSSGLGASHERVEWASVSNDERINEVFSRLSSNFGESE